MDTVSFGAPTYAYADVLSLVALEQLRRSELRLEPQKGPIPTVLETSCVRTGLQVQKKDGAGARIALRRAGWPYPPVHGTRRGHRNLESPTTVRLPRFADQLGVPALDIQRLFADH